MKNEQNNNYIYFNDEWNTNNGTTEDSNKGGEGTNRNGECGCEDCVCGNGGVSKRAEE